MRRFRYISAITIRWLRPGRPQGWNGEGCRRVDGSGNAHRPPDGQVEHGPKEDRADAAEAVEERLRNTIPQKRHAHRQAGDQDAGGAQRGPQLDPARLEPSSNSHGVMKVYISTVSKSQRKRKSRVSLGAARRRLETPPAGALPRRRPRPRSRGPRTCRALHLTARAGPWLQRPGRGASGRGPN